MRARAIAKLASTAPLRAPRAGDTTHAPPLGVEACLQNVVTGESPGAPKGAQMQL